MKLRLIAFLLCCLSVAVPASAGAQDEADLSGVSLNAVDLVWSGHDVAPGIAIGKERIVIAYFDASRQISVASRPLEADVWTFHKLDSWVGWDSHNALAVAADARGHIHVAGNMHVEPLIYYRSTRPGDVRSLERVEAMVDQDTERSVTYPAFFTGSEGELIFKYRDGGSGNGNEIYNILDAESGHWRRLTESPLLDGEGERNAYFVGPVQGPRGWFHLTWVWRDTPDAGTNHDLSYARSHDLVSWQDADGNPLDLPITLDTTPIVDPVPARGGMINNNTLIGFDSEGRVLIAYHKFDEDGNTQVYLARHEESGWRSYQVSRWRDFRWDFGGWGSLDFRLRLEAPRMIANDRLAVRVTRDGIAYDLIVDEETLAPLDQREAVRLADLIGQRMNVAAGLQMNSVSAPGGLPALVWPSLPPRGDRSPSVPIPQPQTLFLVTQKPAD